MELQSVETDATHSLIPVAGSKFLPAMSKNVAQHLDDDHDNGDDDRQPDETS
jgi:hypothetical protein